MMVSNRPAASHVWFSCLDSPGDMEASLRIQSSHAARLSAHAARLSARAVFVSELGS